MSSMHRILDGEVLVHHLTQDERMLDPELLARHGRTARTLVKEGPLRLTIMGIAAGGHRAHACVTDGAPQSPRDISIRSVKGTLLSALDIGPVPP
jgi:hypothetical protein